MTTTLSAGVTPAPVGRRGPIEERRELTRPAAWWLSWAIIPLAAAGSIGGLFMNGLYQDPAAVSTRFRASDLITLVIALPLLGGALVASRPGSRRGALIWAALLAYAVYDYAFYAFGMAFNDLFLVHVALFTLALFALVFPAGQP